MALTNTTKMANRCGLDLKFYAYSADGTFTAESPVCTIDFANEVSIEITSDLVWATGGQAHKNMIGFKNPSEGTMTISTQITNSQLMKLRAGNDVSVNDNRISIMNDNASIIPKYYIVTGTTLWQGEDGVTYDEDITLYKVCIKPSFSATYTGDGDPQSMDIEFDLATNDEGKMAEIVRTEQSASDGGGEEEEGGGV